MESKLLISFHQSFFYIIFYRAVILHLLHFKYFLEIVFLFQKPRQKIAPEWFILSEENEKLWT